MFFNLLSTFQSCITIKINFDHLGKLFNIDTVIKIMTSFNFLIQIHLEHLIYALAARTRTIYLQKIPVI